MSEITLQGSIDKSGFDLTNVTNLTKIYDELSNLKKQMCKDLEYRLTENMIIKHDDDMQKVYEQFAEENGKEKADELIKRICDIAIKHIDNDAELPVSFSPYYSSPYYNDVSPYYNDDYETVFGGYNYEITVDVDLEALKEAVIEGRDDPKKYVVTIYSGGDVDFLCLYDKDEMWKQQVSADFDETFVIKGNRDYTKIEITEASWYKKTVDLIDSLYDNSEDYEEILEHQPNGATGEKDELFAEYAEWYKDNFGIDEKQLLEICAVLKTCKTTDSLDTECDVAKVLYPEKDFVVTTIRGILQCDWNEVLYEVSSVEQGTIQELSDYYFGQVAEVHIQLFDKDVEKEDYDNAKTYEDYWDTISDSNLCALCRDDKEMINKFRERFDLPKDCGVEILEASSKRVQSYEYETVAQDMQKFGKSDVKAEQNKTQNKGEIKE